MSPAVDFDTIACLDNNSNVVAVVEVTTDDRLKMSANNERM
jgi:hypothetical protein